MRPAFHDVLDELDAARTDFAGPVDEPAGRPLQIFLVSLGPVLLVGGELTRLKTAHVRRHPLGLVEQLHGRLRQPHVQFDVNE